MIRWTCEGSVYSVPSKQRNLKWELHCIWVSLVVVLGLCKRTVVSRVIYFIPHIWDCRERNFSCTLCVCVCVCVCVKTGKLMTVSESGNRIHYDLRICSLPEFFLK